MYVIIQGINPENNQIIESEENIEKDQLVQEWVKTTLSEVMAPDLLRSFKESILLSINSIFFESKGSLHRGNKVPVQKTTVSVE